MQYQKIHVDFLVKKRVKTSLEYKRNDIDTNGIDVTTSNVELNNASAYVRFKNALGEFGEPIATTIDAANNTINFQVPTGWTGQNSFEIVVTNENGTVSSAELTYKVFDTLGEGDALVVEYETLYATISSAFEEWRQDHERFEQTNDTLLATNAEAEQKIAEMDTQMTAQQTAFATAQAERENDYDAFRTVADAKVVEVNQAISNAETATQATIQATSESETATANANTATTATIQATTDAQTATTQANTATNNANVATSNANNAATLANEKATLADQKATLADQKATLAQAAVDDFSEIRTNVKNDVIATVAPPLQAQVDQKIAEVNSAIAAGTVDLELKDARTSAAGVVYANLKERLDTENKALNEDYFGVEFTGSNTTGKRLGRAVGLVANVGLGSTVNVNDFDNQFPWSQIQTVNLSHDGVVTAIEGFPNFKRDGSNGEVMVRIPKFYQKREQNADGSIKRYFISKFKRSGYYLNPAFIDSDTGKELNYAFIGAYEASSDGTKLFSRSGLYPLVSTNRAGFRTRAKATGTGFHLEDVLLRNLIEFLFYIEFATTNSQAIMNGQVSFSPQKTTIATTDANYVIVSNTSANQYSISQTILINGTTRKLLSKTSHDASNTRLNFDSTPLTVAFDSTIDMRGWQCGSADSVVQRSGSIQSNSAGKSPFVYRGIENPWGNIWEFIDGLNINEFRSYICTNYKLYADQTYVSPYEPLAVLNGNANGYVSKMIFDPNQPWAQIPESVSGGGSTTYFADYYYQNSGERTAFVGGTWHNGAIAGLSSWLLDSSPAASDALIGGRLAYKPSS